MPEPSLVTRRGLYAICDTETLSGRNLTSSAAQAIQGGAVMLQYRDKCFATRTGRSRRLKEASQLAQLCSDANVPFIVNDDLDLAVACEADGVHLGKDDQHVLKARDRLDPAAIIGQSCYGALHRAHKAIENGASYIAFGAFFHSTTKPAAPRSPLLILQAAKQFSPVPVTAIGGITPRNAGLVASAGADLIAVISSLFLASNIEQQARQLTMTWRNSACHHRAGLTTEVS